LSTDIVGRYRNSTDTANILTIAGNGTVWANGAGYVESNTAFGQGALDANTTGTINAAFGLDALGANTTGSGNSSFGRRAMYQMKTGTSNSVFGLNSLYNSNGIANSCFGVANLFSKTSGNNNSCFGFHAGRYISDGVTGITIANNSVFLGADTKANADNQTNQIVIGHNAIGLGSNTVVLGNTSIVTTQLRGTVRLSLQASAPTGVEGAIYYDSTTKKHYGHNGTAWNALY
jgi:hypothetical protein